MSSSPGDETRGQTWLTYYALHAKNIYVTDEKCSLLLIMLTYAAGKVPPHYIIIITTTGGDSTHL